VNRLHDIGHGGIRNPDGLLDGSDLACLLHGAEFLHDAAGGHQFDTLHGLHPLIVGLYGHILALKGNALEAKGRQLRRQHTWHLLRNLHELKVRSLLAHLLIVAEIGGEARYLWGDNEDACRASKPA